MHFHYSIGRQLHWTLSLLLMANMSVRRTHKSQRNRFQSAFLLFVLVSDANINYYMPTYATMRHVLGERVCVHVLLDCVAIINRHCSHSNLFCTHHAYFTIASCIARRKMLVATGKRTRCDVLSDPFHIVANCSGQNILHFCFYAVVFFFFASLSSSFHVNLCVHSSGDCISIVTNL